MEEFQNKPSRPSLLTTVCILTFVYTGLSFLFSIIKFFSGPFSDEEMLEQRVRLTKSITQLKELDMDYFVQVLQQTISMGEEINANFYGALVISIIVLLVGFFGAFMMWNGKKIGFHLYIIYSLIAVAQLYLFVSPGNISTLTVVPELLLGGAFVFMYSRNLSWLK
ncbi:MAG: hypothetical protein ACO2Z9_07805 [Crocinitomicaceae bacterium]